MNRTYLHGYDDPESLRLQDQARTLEELLHSDSFFPSGSRVLEAGCGVGAQTLPLARRNPGTRITSVDLAASSVAATRARVAAAGLDNVTVRQVDIFALQFEPRSFDHAFLCFVLEHLSRRSKRSRGYAPSSCLAECSR